MAIVLTDISKRFAEHLVVNRLKLEVASSELFVLLGSSGSGKSTILRIIAGLLEPDAGRVELHGQDVTNVPAQERNTGFVFQNYAIFKHMSVSANVEFGLKVRGVARSERRRRCEDLLELVGLGGLGTRRPFQLSGGQRQRVALARALAYRPAVLLLDEPFGALDVKIRSQLRALLKNVQRELKITTILVTHDQEEAFELGDRIGVLERGRLVETGTPEQLYYRPRQEFTARFLGGGNVLVGRRDGDHICLGSNILAWPPGAPHYDEGAPVRILFRPETVLHQARPFGPGPGPATIGEGRVVERTFAGPIERIRFELATLEGARPLAPALAYGQRFANVFCTQPSRSADLEVGERRWLGLESFHVLDPTGLKTVLYVDGHGTYRSALPVTQQIVGTSHGPATLCAIARYTDSLETARKRLQEAEREASRGGELHFELRGRQGSSSWELVREVQEAYHELVIIGRPDQEEPAEQDRLLYFLQRVLVFGGVPVLLVRPSTKKIARMLMATSAGELGKTDVGFAARLARHLKPETRVLGLIEAEPSAEAQGREERHLAQAQALLAAFGVPSTGSLTSGPAAEAIKSAAEAGGHDLIVLGSFSVPERPLVRASDLVSRIVLESKQAVLIVPQGTGIEADLG